MKNFKDYIEEAVNQRELKKLWDAVCTPKVQKIVDKEWPALREYFDILVPQALSMNKPPKLALFFLLDVIDNESIAEFESKTMKQATEEFKEYLGMIDADLEGTDVDSYIKNW